MYRVRDLFIGLIALLLNPVCFAASDPVSWTQLPATGFPAVEIGGSTNVVYTLTNHLPGPVLMRTRILKNGPFTVQDACNNQTLARNGSCTIVLTFAPTIAGQYSIQLIYGYHNNEIPLPVLSATANGHTATDDVNGVFSSVPAFFTLSNPVERPTFTLTYMNNGTAAVTGFAGNAGGANILTTDPSTVASVAVLSNNCGTSSAPITLNPGDVCQIQGQLTPLSLGQFTLNGLFTYNNGLKTVDPSAVSMVINGSGSCVANASVQLPLPTNTYRYADNVVAFVFENECVSDSTTLSQVVLTPNFNPAAGQSAAIVIGEDHCSNTILGPQSSCVVTASVISQGAGSSMMAITAGVLSNSVPVSTVTVASVSPPAYQHRVTFVNQCSFPVWYGIANDNNTNKADPTNPAGPDDYLLAAQIPGMAPSTKTVTFPGDYLGLFFPRTGCQTIGNQLFCETGQCIPDNPPNGGRCSLGHEPVPPYTKLEMNFFALAQGDGSFDGVYDVSLIEGFNVPTEMKAFGPGATVIPYPANPVNNSSFQCTGAGALIQPANPPTPDLPLASCPWVVTPPSANTMAPQFFNFVTDGDEAAGQNNCSCTAANPVCGIAYKASDPQKGNLIMSCGQLIGTWALKTLCTQPFATTVPLTINNDSRLRFGCDNDLSTATGRVYPNGTTLSDLYGCVFNSATPTYLNSCYKDVVNSTTFCCGATDWNTTIPYVTAQDKQSITQNPDWGGPTVGGVSPIVPSPYESIVWYKNACPTAYSYPFDDHSTSFYCKQSSPGVNVKMDYQVVFCPGGVAGIS